MMLSNCTKFDFDDFDPTDAEACLDACDTLSTDGSPSAYNEDTVQCRISHIVTAANDPGQLFHCGHGAPVPTEYCDEPVPSPDCDTYCEIMYKTCPEQLLSGNLDTCPLACDASGVLLGKMGDTWGNSLGCRIFHAGNAFYGDPQACQAASPAGGNVCGSYCTVYCDLAMAVCKDDNQLYDVPDTCIDTCLGFDTSGAPEDFMGNTLQCRVNWLLLATHSPESTDQACKEASAASDAQCVPLGN